MIIAPRSSLSLYIGNYIRKRRKKAGLSGNELAELVNVSQQQISRYERGKNKLTIDMLCSILFSLGLTLEEMYSFFIKASVFYYANCAESNRNCAAECYLSRRDF